ncbi:MAG: hypothetical protein KC442_09775 [Thermomicrobiales bacterium]|nr:hypothetical protein [Thermomicrobiales bacterium]
MDGTQFAAGLRQIGRRVTRRGAFAALVAGAVLNKTAPGSDATKRAKRRKARKRKSTDPTRIRPIYIWIQNPTPNPVTLAYGDGRWCCNVLNREVTVPPHGKVAVSSGYNTDTDDTWGFLWIKERYWVSFHNTWLQRPDLTAALDGQPVGRWCCLPEPRGTLVVDARPMSIGALTSFRLADHSFWVQRERDTNYIVFTVILPPTI